MADLAECTRHAIESVEQGRLKLSTRLGFKISQAYGVDFGWLMANDPSLPMMNHGGRSYTEKDFKLAQSGEDLKSLQFYRIEPEMEIGVAYDLLCRVLESAYAKSPLAVSDFLHRLEWYVRSEIGRFGDLQDTIYTEIQKWGREFVGTGKSYPKSFLFPRSTESFKRGRQKFDEAIPRIEANLLFPRSTESFKRGRQKFNEAIPRIEEWKKRANQRGKTGSKTIKK